MKCMVCGAEDTKVIDSRLVGDGDQVRRRRQCLVCAERFTTYEHAELTLPRIVKRDGSRVSFDEQKMRVGLLRALEKRPVASDEIEAVIGRIKHKLQVVGEREVPARQIGEWIMQELRELDQVAYVRFASVYRSFQDVNAFKEEIDRLNEAH
jgi:transcriptional repressor NrdR